MAFVLVATTLPAQADLGLDVSSDADWIMSARMADGAIANYVDKQAVWPYLSNFAAMGLARATTVTRNKTYAQAAWTWLGWYQAHMDATGFVTDYRMVNGVLTSTGDMDSTDAYAGTFLLAVREAYRASNDAAKVKSLATGIAKAVNAIEATQAADGMTWAKPTWHVKYLMDQAETYAGLLAAVDLAKLNKDSALQTRAQNDANRMKAGVATTWNATTGAFDWAVHDTGARTPTDWKILYSDSLQQAWAASFGLVDSARATALMSKFTASQPNWSVPLATALFSGGSTAQVGYWPVAGFALNVLKNPTAATAAASIRSGSLTAKRAWPFTTGNAGQLILFESGWSLPLAVSTSTATTTKSTVTPTLRKSTSGSSYSAGTASTGGVGGSKSTTTTTRKPPTTAPSPAPTTTAPKPTTTTTTPLAQVTPVPGGPTVTVPHP